MTAIPITPQFGLEIDGVAGSELVDRSAADECADALDRYGVVVHRNAFISDDDLVALSALLGDVVVQPTGEHRRPEIQTITLDPAKAAERMLPYRRGNFFWHIDGATQAVPQKATLLSAIDVAEEGGDTEFASTYAAYEALRSSERAEIDELQVVHSFAAAQRRTSPDPTPDELDAWSRVPERVHPLVWQRSDGRRSMLLGVTADHVVGWSRSESEALLGRLLDWSTQSEFVLRHQWRRGDLVIWDNTGLLHRALPFEPTSPRLLHRTTLAGDV
jgi:alpha-ketoglutarate-dependent taurine dioxygenase